MSDHLPECPTWAEYEHLCICDRLRSCEQRVREEERALIAVEQTTLEELNAEYLKGVAAAQEAVEKIQQFAHTIYESPSECQPGETGKWIVRHDALAVISRLRRESK